MCIFRKGSEGINTIDGGKQDEWLMSGVQVLTILFDMYIDMYFATN